MAKLTGQSIAASYDQLLIVDDANGISASLQAVESADTGGSASSLKISTSKVEVIPASDSTALFEVSQADGTAVLSVDTTNARVGIGTSPAHRFNVASEDSTPTNGFDGDAGMRIQGSHNAILDIGTLGVSPYGTWFQVYDMRESNATKYPLLLNPVGGDVGIGTASPSQLLTVSSSSADAVMAIDCSYAGGDGLLIIESASGRDSIIRFTEADTLKWQIYNDGNDDDKLKIQDDGDVRVTFDQSGNVGINESSPAHKLDVDGGIVEQGGVLKENLLTNSGFDVWSNSTLENVGSDLVTNGTFESDTTGWGGGNCSLSISGDGGGQSGENLILTRSSGSSQYAQDGLTVEVGKLYKLTAYVKEGSGGAEAFQISFVDSATNEVGSISGTSSGSWVAYSVVVEATTTTSYIRLYRLDGDSGTMFFDTVSCYEVTPGCVAADTLGPDGWGKDSTLDLWRQHNDGGTLTKDGSFYALKTLTGGANRTLYGNFSQDGLAEMYQRYNGRTLTMGAWVKTSTANHCKLRLYDGSDTDSAFHTGGGAWEWLEITDTMSASATYFRPTIFFAIDATVAYISQPMLVFGSSIGEGNYTRPMNEVIWFEKQVDSNFYEGLTSQSDQSMTTLNLEADSNGAIPKGAKAVMVYNFIKDSGSAAGQPYLRMDAGSTVGNFFVNEASGITNDAQSRASGIQNCDENGDIRVQMEATGSGTLDIDGFEYKGVELR